MKLTAVLASGAIMGLGLAPAVQGVPESSAQSAASTHATSAREMQTIPWNNGAAQGEAATFETGLKVNLSPAPRSQGAGLGKVAFIELKHPQQGLSPVTGKEASVMLLSAAQDFFDRNVPGSVVFRVERVATHALSYSPCGREGQADDAVRKALAIPRDVRIVMLTRYAGASAEKCRYSGLAILATGNLPGYVLLNGTTVDSGTSIPGYAAWEVRETLIHELGHSFSLDHAERFACRGGATPVDAASCSARLWPGIHDVMGYWGTSQDPLLVHSRWTLGSVDQEELHHPAEARGSGRLWEERAWANRTGNGWRAVKLEDRYGSYWLEYRSGSSSAQDPRGNWREFTPGVVIHMQVAPGTALKTPSSLDLRRPIQVDITPSTQWSPAGDPVDETPQTAADTLPAGATWTTPGGTVITVTAQGDGWADITWAGPGDRNPPARETNAPTLRTPAGLQLRSGTTTRSPVHVMPPYASDTGTGVALCALKGAPGTPAIFRSEQVLLEPTAAWWKERRAKSLVTGRELPVRGGSVLWGGPAPISAARVGPYAGVAAELRLPAGRYTLSWACQDRAGNWSKPSPSFSVTISR